MLEFRVVDNLNISCPGRFVVGIMLALAHDYTRQGLLEADLLGFTEALLAHVKAKAEHKADHADGPVGNCGCRLDHL